MKRSRLLLLVLLVPSLVLWGKPVSANGSPGINLFVAPGYPAHYMFGHHWPLGTVSIVVDDPSTGVNPDYSTDVESVVGGGVFAETAKFIAHENARQNLLERKNPTIVAPTDKEARELAHAYYPHFARTQMEHYESKDDYWKDVRGYEAHSRFFANLSRLVTDADFRDRFFDNKLVGTPERVIRRIETIRDKLKVGHVVTVHTQYEMEQSLRHRSMQMFAEQVLPHFHNAAEAA